MGILIAEIRAVSQRAAEQDQRLDGGEERRHFISLQRGSDTSSSASSSFCLLSSSSSPSFPDLSVFTRII